MTNEPREPEAGDVATETHIEVRRPPLFKVLMYNDDYTTRDFVVAVLETIFQHPTEVAVQIMLNVHNQGSGIAGLFPYETAEAKVDRVHSLARENDSPLCCSIEPE